MLPVDVNILFSYINTLLRDKYSSLEDLCEDMDVDPEELEQKLRTIGKVYSPKENRFL